MRTIPRKVAMHAGQRRAQLAWWGFHWSEDGQWKTRLIRRVTKQEWQGLHVSGLHVHRVILDDGLMIVTGIGPTATSHHPPHNDCTCPYCGHEYEDAGIKTAR